MKKITYTTPAGKYPLLYADMLKQPHLLIAGATGSGKSVAINGIIYTALYSDPIQVQFIFIDPKRVELIEYKKLPHCLLYASEPGEMVAALDKALDITESRYKTMQGDCKKYPGGDIYLIIDELADLMTTQKKQVMPRLQRLAQIGRAAKIHIIAATQCPLAAVIPTQIKVNFDARLALRTRSRQDSYNIIERSGCESLPRYGEGYYMKPEGIQLYKIPYIEDKERERLIKFWMQQKKPRHIFKQH